jgi:hypothetical protein
MNRRRALKLILLVFVAALLYRVAELSVISAKLFDYSAVFDLWKGPVGRETVMIGQIPADIYTGARSRLPMLMVHGVNQTGKDSPEIRSVAEAFAGSGFRVLVPQFERLTRQNVSAADVDDITFVFKSLNTDGGIVCASYGCGPALIAAARPEIRDRVRFIVAFGSYFDLTETLQYIVTGPPTPLAYSKWTYMAANSNLIEDAGARRRLLAIAAERIEHPPEEWTLSAADLEPGAREMLELYESRTPAEFHARLSGVPSVRDLSERLSPSRYFDGLRARLIIVHIASDPSIPSSQSIRMAEAARARGIPYSLTIMNMYGHTKPQWPPISFSSVIGFYIPEGFRFLRVLNEILSQA